MVITLQDVVNWARTQIKMIPLVGVGGFTNEPALTLCNMVLQEVLSGGIDPLGKSVGPFPWKWNRKEATPFDTVEYQQDYSTTVSDLGWLESCEIEDKNSTAIPKPRQAIDVVRSLPKDSARGGPPQAICWNLDNTSGYVIWRVRPTPSGTIYTVYPVYQQKPIIKTALSQNWAPIPDECAYVYRQGLLAMAKKHAGQDWASEYQIFQAMIKKALGIADAEQQSQGFVPERSILLG